MPPTVVLGLGSNLGAREDTLARALAALEARGFRRRRESSLYLTEPVGGPPQDWYINQVVAGDTALTPEQLLEASRDVEQAFDRVRSVRDAPRTLDIDILLYGDVVTNSPELTLPHPRLHERRFVLVPLAEIAPELVHPRFGLSVKDLLERCSDRSRVILHAPAGKRA